MSKALRKSLAFSAKKILHIFQLLLLISNLESKTFKDLSLTMNTKHGEHRKSRNLSYKQQKEKPLKKMQSNLLKPISIMSLKWESKIFLWNILKLEIGKLSVSLMNSIRNPWNQISLLRSITIYFSRILTVLIFSLWTAQSSIHHLISKEVPSKSKIMKRIILNMKISSKEMLFPLIPMIFRICKVFFQDKDKLSLALAKNSRNYKSFKNHRLELKHTWLNWEDSEKWQ